MLPKKCEDVKRQESQLQIKNEEIKEEMEEGEIPSSPIQQDIKMEEEDTSLNILKCGYGHSTVLFKALEPSCLKIASVAPIPVKTENTSDIASSSSRKFTMQISAVKNEVGDQQTIASSSLSSSKTVPITNRPFNHMQSALGTFSAVKSEKTTTDCNLVLPLCAPMLTTTNFLLPKDQSVAENSQKLPPECTITIHKVCSVQLQPKVTRPSNALGLVNEAPKFLTTEDIEEIQNTKEEFELVDLTIDDVSPVSTAPPSPTSKDDAEDLLKQDLISTERNIEFPVPLFSFLDLNYSLDVILYAQKLAAAEMDRSKEMDMTRNLTVTEQEPVLMEEDNDEIVVIYEEDATAKKKTLMSKSPVLQPPIAPRQDTAISAPLETVILKSTQSIAVQPMPDCSVVPMDISPTTSPIPPDKHFNKDYFLEIIASSNKSHQLLVSSNLSTSKSQYNITVDAVQQPPAILKKRSLSPADSLNNQSSKKMNINEYRLRKEVDPTLKSPSRLSSDCTPSPPIITSHQTVSPHSVSQIFSPPQCNPITLCSLPQHPTQSYLFTSQVPFQYPLQSNLFTSHVPLQYPLQSNLFTSQAPLQYSLQSNLLTSQTPAHPMQNNFHSGNGSLFSSRNLLHEAQQVASGTFLSSSPVSSPSPIAQLGMARYTSVQHLSQAINSLGANSSLGSHRPFTGMALVDGSTQSAVTKAHPIQLPLLKPSLLPSKHVHLGLPCAAIAPRPVKAVTARSTVQPCIVKPNNNPELPRFTSSIPDSFKSRVGKELIPTQDLYLIVIDWDVAEMHDLYQKNEFPNLATEFNQVRNTYSDHLDYYNTYFPLMLVDYWHKLFSRYSSPQRLDDLFCVAKHWVHVTKTNADSPVRTFRVHCETIVNSSHAGALPTQYQVVAVNCLSGQFLGYVLESERRDFLERDRQHVMYKRNGLGDDKTPKSKLRIVIELACEKLPFKVKDVLGVKKLASIKGLLRQNTALLELSNSPLQKVLLNPITLGWVELITVPTCLLVEKMIFALEALTTRVAKLRPQITLVSLSDTHPRTDQLTTLVQIVRCLLLTVGERLLVCVRDETFEEAAQMILQLGCETVLLDREIRRSESEHSFDVLAKKSSKRSILDDCEVLLACSGNCFYEDIRDAASGFEVCILFEANQLTEPESLLPISYSVRQLVLIGTPGKSCRTSPMTARWDFRKSLFQRAYDTSG